MTPDGVDAIINAAGAVGVGLGPLLLEQYRNQPEKLYHTWCEMFAGYNDRQVLDAARAWFATCRPGEWLDGRAILAHLRPPQDEGSRAVAAEVAANELAARALQWATDPLSPDEPDVALLPAGPLLVTCRFSGRVIHVHDKLDRPVYLPERRPDGRWRVAGEPARATRPRLERFVWGLLRDLGGVERLRDAAREGGVGWNVWSARWRDLWEDAGRSGRSPSPAEVRSGLALPPPPVAPVGLQIADRGEARDRSAELARLGVVVERVRR